MGGGGGGGRKEGKRSRREKNKNLVSELNRTSMYTTPFTNDQIAHLSS